MSLQRISTRIVEVTPVIDTNIYASGDQIGTVLRLNNAVQDYGGFSRLKSITVIDKAKQSAAIDFLFFDDEPTNAVTNNNPADISYAEMGEKCIGVLSVASADYKSLANSSVVTSIPNGNGLLVAGERRSRSIWVLAVSRGTPTYTSTSDLVFKFGFEQN